MFNFFRKYFLVAGIIFLIPFLVSAQEVNPYKNVEPTSTVNFIEEQKGNNQQLELDEVFRAKVVEILEEKKIEDNGQLIKQQNLKLKGLSGSFKNKDIYFYGIDDFQVGLVPEYKAGDKVLVSHNLDLENQDIFYIIDYVRNTNIYLLAFIFLLCMVVIGRWKGLRAIIALIITFIIILKLILPAILNGHNPILISIGGGFLILFFIIYITEGINKKSHISLLSILISLFITGVLAIIFSNLMKLNGVSEDSIYLINLIDKTINFKGLLFAGVIIGSLGVLNDMVVSQVSTVLEIKNANFNLSNKEILKRAYRVGVSHVSSMANTLFLAYAGSALSILLLFSIGGMNFTNILNNHLIATEIFRGLIGAIGIVLSMPISTFLASYYFKNNSPC